MSCFRSSSLSSSNGHLLPSSRNAFIFCHSGCRPKTCCRTDVGLNSLPFPSGEFCCAFSAFPKSRSYFLNTSMLCAAPSSVNSKLNSGGEGVGHLLLMTARIRRMRSLGQSKEGGCGMSRSSLSGGCVKIQGEFLHSPSSCANCCDDDVNVVSRRSSSRLFLNSS